MFHPTATTRFQEVESDPSPSLHSPTQGSTVREVLKNPLISGLPHAMRLLRLTLISGPKVLLTSRINGKCAALMMLMCSPSLLFCSILTIPALLFQSPQQHAYYYFSMVLNQDPSRWVVLLLAGTCALLSLAIPATMPEPRTSVSYY